MEPNPDPVSYSTAFALIARDMVLSYTGERENHRLHMGSVVVFANQKGGVGKTTSAVNIGSYIAEAGRRVLLVDFDPQGNMSSSVGADGDLGMYEVVSGTARARDAVTRTSQKNLYVIRSDINLSGANVELVGEKRREFFLKKALEEEKRRWDYVFIDCPPSLGILTVNGLVAADSVVIPLQCEYFALEGLTLLLQTIRKVQRGLNSALVIAGIVFTMYDTRTRLAHEVVEEVTGYFKDKVFRTIIPRNVRLSEAPSHGKPINQYDPSCIGALSYKKLADEVMKRG